MKLLRVLPVVALLAACGSTPSSADVNWHRYSPEWGESVRDAVTAGDCDTMFRAWEAALGADDGELEDYLATAMEREECPGW